MSRLFAYLWRFLMIVAGFVAASLAASLFINLLVISAFRFDGEAMPHALAGGLYVGVPFLALFVGYFAFWPAMAVIVLTELFAKRDWLFHALGGGAVGIAILGYSWARPQQGMALDDPAFILALVTAGLVGGIAYWLVAGHSAGRGITERDRSPIAPER